MVFPHAIPHRRCALRTPRAHTHAFSWCSTMLWACAIGSDVQRTRGKRQILLCNCFDGFFCAEQVLQATPILGNCSPQRDAAVTGKPGKGARHSLPPHEYIPPTEASKKNTYIGLALQRTTGLGFTLAVLVGAQLILYDMSVLLNKFVSAALSGVAQKSSITPALLT